MTAPSMNEVERVHAELQAIEAIVSASGDMSAIANFGAHSAKVLLLTSASYFERRIVLAIEEHLNAGTSSPLIRHFTLHQSIERKFFSLFDFSADAKNINAFLTKFGPGFARWAKDDLVKCGIGSDVQTAFLDLCRLRNSLVHNNYATYDINKTMAEIRTSFDTALKFIQWVETAFTRFPIEADQQ